MSEAFIKWYQARYYRWFSTLLRHELEARKAMAEDAFNAGFKAGGRNDR